MIVTPSSRGSFLAGVAFWSLVWLSVTKLDEIAACLRLRRWLSTERCLAWVDQHRALTLLGTECSNYATHGISNVLGVTFALGGTLVNVVVICLLIPLRARTRALLARRFSLR